MEKIGVVASLGQGQLLRPAWITAALAANDRLKLYLTLQQAAQPHTEQPSVPWLKDLPGTAYRTGKVLHVPDLVRLAMQALGADFFLTLDGNQGMVYASTTHVEEQVPEELLERLERRRRSCV